LTAGAREFILIYDGSRSHLGLRALETLKAGNVIAYDLPTNLWYNEAIRRFCLPILQASHAHFYLGCP